MPPPEGGSPTVAAVLKQKGREVVIDRALRHRAGDRGPDQVAQGSAMVMVLGEDKELAGIVSERDLVKAHGQ